jgi:hypothetical protein
MRLISLDLITWIIVSAVKNHETPRRVYNLVTRHIRASIMRILAAITRQEGYYFIKSFSTSLNRQVDKDNHKASHFSAERCA